jgi:hypothetical protein
MRDLLGGEGFVEVDGRVALHVFAGLSGDLD